MAAIEPHGADRVVIDNPAQAARLLEKLGPALPLPAHVVPELATMLRAQALNVDLPTECLVIAVRDGGDEAGIVCKLAFGAGMAKAVYASITHLRFDPRLPVVKDIAKYQKRRIKRLRQPG